MSQYKSLKTFRNGIKIWKSQNHMSAIDITHMLNSHREKGDEWLYSGKLCFAIFEKKGQENLYEKAYIDKSTAKLVLHKILNGKFLKDYPIGGKGFENFRGGIKDGKIFSKKLSIKGIEYKGEIRVNIGIEVMPGKKTKTGAYIPIGAPTLRVNKMLSVDELTEMAVELNDFIKAAEMVALNKGSSLHTLTSLEYEEVSINEQGRRESNHISSSRGFSIIDPNNFQNMSPEEFQKYYLKLTEETRQISNNYRAAKAEHERRTGNQNPTA